MRARPLRKAHATEALARVRGMRREMTLAETLLWRNLRGRRLNEAKFKRQVWVGAYIADFVCMEAMLIVEADGGQHGEQEEYDSDRSAALAAAGWRVLRFWNNEILSDVGAVLGVIADALRAPSPSRSASPNGSLPLPPGEG